jgi:hypothetical protein
MVNQKKRLVNKPRSNNLEPSLTRSPNPPATRPITSWASLFDQAPRAGVISEESKGCPLGQTLPLVSRKAATQKSPAEDAKKVKDNVMSIREGGGNLEKRTNNVTKTRKTGPPRQTAERPIQDNPKISSATERVPLPPKHDEDEKKLRQMMERFHFDEDWEFVEENGQTELGASSDSNRIQGKPKNEGRRWWFW